MIGCLPAVVIALALWPIKDQIDPEFRCYISPNHGGDFDHERRLSLNQIAVPDDFPSDEFDAVSGKLGSTYGERYEYHAYIRDALNAIAAFLAPKVQYFRAPTRY
jgi:hypothetical protein